MLVLPEDGREALTHTGLPEEVRLAGRAGPAVFTLGWYEGYALAADRHPATRQRLRHPDLVLGFIADDQTDTPVLHAAFVAQADGAVRLDDLAGREHWVVNASIPQFVASLSALVAAWPKIRSARNELAAIRALDALRDRIAELDPAAFDHADGYWRAFLEDLRTG